MLHHLPPTILIIEPDVILRTNMSNSLERSGFNVIITSKASEALQLLDNIPLYQKPSIIVIRDELEGLELPETLSTIKNKSSLKKTNILVVSDDIKKVLNLKNLKHTFDDFILRPFSQGDFVQKIKAILGKNRPSLASRVLVYKDLTMDLASYKVTRAGREIHLGPTEFKILQCLIENPKKIFSREDIMKYVWGANSHVEIRTIDVHVNRLRSALKQPSEISPFIKTVRSLGYCLDFSR